MPDVPAIIPETENTLPEARPYTGIAAAPFNPDECEILLSPVVSDDVEIRPDGIMYLPEIKYRRILNRAFRPGAWALLPRGEWKMQDNTLMRSYALIVHERFVSEAVGEQDYIPNNPNMTYATASEGVRSNALMRCCKDLGIASELWDPGFIEQWKRENAVQVWRKGGGKPNWRRKDREPFWDEVRVMTPGDRPQPPQQEPRPDPRPQQALKTERALLGQEILAYCNGDKKTAAVVMEKLTGKKESAKVTEEEAIEGRKKFKEFLKAQQENKEQPQPGPEDDIPDFKTPESREPGQEG